MEGSQGDTKSKFFNSGHQFQIKCLEFKFKEAIQYQGVKSLNLTNTPEKATCAHVSQEMRRQKFDEAAYFIPFLAFV